MDVRNPVQNTADNTFDQAADWWTSLAQGYFDGDGTINLRMSYFIDGDCYPSIPRYTRKSALVRMEIKPPVLLMVVSG